MGGTPRWRSPELPDPRPGASRPRLGRSPTPRPPGRSRVIGGASPSRTRCGATSASGPSTQGASATASPPVQTRQAAAAKPGFCRVTSSRTVPTAPQKIPASSDGTVARPHGSGGSRPSSIKGNCAVPRCRATRDQAEPGGDRPPLPDRPLGHPLDRDRRAARHHDPRPPPLLAAQSAHHRQGPVGPAGVQLGHVVLDRHVDHRPAPPDLRHPSIGQKSGKALGQRRVDRRDQPVGRPLAELPPVPGVRPGCPVVEREGQRRPEPTVSLDRSPT